MSHELTHFLGDAIVWELGERAAQLLFYENEGNGLFWSVLKCHPVGEV